MPFNDFGIQRCYLNNIIGRGVLLIKNYVIDTNVMIHDPQFLSKFDDNNIIIPIICIQELDNLKNKEGIVGYQARSAAREYSVPHVKTIF